MLYPTVKFMRECPLKNMRRGETTGLRKTHNEWSIWGVDNKAADMLCACSMNKGKTLIKIMRCYLINFQDS